MLHIVLLHIQIIASVVMLLMWLVQLKIKDASTVDVAWSSLIFLSTVVCFIRFGHFDLRHCVISFLPMFWSLRISIYLSLRIRNSTQEDSRYLSMRNAFGKFGQLVFFVFYQAQALFVTLFMLPILILLQTPSNMISTTDYIGIAVFILALVGEYIADRQLMRFKKTHQGVTCQVGLWNYSRHPNYFFEWLGWFAYPFLCIDSKLFSITLLFPFVVLLFLFKLTGISHVERESIRNKSDYEAYIATTSVFIPWFKTRRMSI